MSGVAVVTDTTQYIPREIMDRHGIRLVSLYVNWDGRTGQGPVAAGVYFVRYVTPDQRFVSRVAIVR